MSKDDQPVSKDGRQDGRRVLCVGLVCVDIISVCREFPLEDTDQRSVDYYWQRGGNASNSSTVFSMLGVDIEFMGTMVKSQEFPFLERDFAACRIRTDNCVVYEDGGPYRSPTAVVLINEQNGSRTILAALNNVVELKFDDFAPLSLSPYQWIHFEGRPNRDCDDMARMIERVLSYNEGRSTADRISVSLEVEKTSRPELKQLMDKPDYVFISKDFAKDHGCATMLEAVDTMIKLCKPGACLICAWGEEGAAAKSSATGEVVTSPAFPPEALIDTLGAGDTFNAATIYALSRGRSLKDSITFGCRVAGAKCGLNGYKGLQGMQNLLV